MNVQNSEKNPQLSARYCLFFLRNGYSKKFFDNCIHSFSDKIFSPSKISLGSYNSFPFVVRAFNWSTFFHLRTEFPKI